MNGDIFKTPKARARGCSDCGWYFTGKAFFLEKKRLCRECYELQKYGKLLDEEPGIASIGALYVEFLVDLC